MGFQVANSVALVTGANRGIGKAIVDKLLTEGASKVYLAVRKLDSVADQVAQYGAKVQPLRLDLTEPESITEAAKVATDVTLLVNNAGYLQAMPMFDAGFEGALKNELEVNALGLLKVAKAFEPVLKSQPEAAFVQLNSVASMRNFDGISSYAASKSVSYIFTQALRSLWSESPIQVLSVHPGPIDTDMARQVGFEDGTPPSVVASEIVTALAEGHFHCFPDPLAANFEHVYQGFAKEIIEAELDVA